MPDQSRFNTRARSIGRHGELAWGSEEHPWSDEVETLDAVLLENGAIRPADEIPDSGVARWTFDASDTRDGIAIDSWNGYDGRINGAVSRVTGAEQTYATNEAYRFDGSSSVTYPRSYQGFPKTLCAWFNPQAGSGFPAVIRDDYHDDGVYSGISIQYTGSGWSLQIGNGNGASTDHRRSHKSSMSLSQGTWYHLVAVVRGVDDVDLYTNGDATNGDVTGTGSSIQYLGSDGVIGYRPAGDYHITGLIDDPRVYSKALTSTEVSNLYSTGRITG